MNITKVNTSRANAVCPKCKTIQNPDIRYTGPDDDPEPLPWSHKCFYCNKTFSQSASTSKFQVVLPPDSKVKQAVIESEFGADLMDVRADKAGNVLAVMQSLPVLDDEEFKDFVNRVGRGDTLSQKVKDITVRLHIAERSVWNYIQNGVPERNRSLRARMAELSQEN